jgi:hypothetical protein
MAPRIRVCQSPGWDWGGGGAPRDLDLGLGDKESVTTNVINYGGAGDTEEAAVGVTAVVGGVPGRAGGGREDRGGQPAGAECSALEQGIPKEERESFRKG